MSSPSSSESPASEAPSSRIALFQVPEVIYTVLAFILIGTIGWFYYHAVDTQVIGFIHDDGVYLSTAKALATGHGFRLLHVVGHPAEIKYPFMYPILLAPIWMLFPKFPENVRLFSDLSIAFTIGACWIYYRYTRSIERFPGWLSLLCIALVVSNFFFIYFCTTVMAEAPYLFFSLLTLWFFQKNIQKHQSISPQTLIILIILSVVTFLTRIPGLALIAAISVWMLLHRQWKNALFYSMGCLFFGMLPWVLWVKFNTPTLTDLNYALVNAYSNYGQEFVLNYFGGKSYWNSLSISVSSFLNRLLEDMCPLIPNFFKIYPRLQNQPHWPRIKEVIGVASTYLLCGYFLLQGISTFCQSFANKRFSTAHLSVPGLYLFFYILLIIFWNYEDQMARFLIVVTPLFWLYFFKPALPLLSQLSSSIQRQKMKALGVWAALLIIGLIALWPVQNSYKIVYRARNEHWVESGNAKGLWREYQDSFAWIRKNTPQNAPLGVGSDTVYYLYTERPTFYIFFASLKREKGYYVKNAFPILMKNLDRERVQYLVAEPHIQAHVLRGPMNIVVQGLLKQFPKRFRLVYSSPRHAINIFQVLTEQQQNPYTHYAPL